MILYPCVRLNRLSMILLFEYIITWSSHHITLASDKYEFVVSRTDVRKVFGGCYWEQIERRNNNNQEGLLYATVVAGTC